MLLCTKARNHHPQNLCNGCVFVTRLLWIRQVTDYYLNLFVSKREKESFAVLSSKTINASCINCTRQIVIHFLFCVFLVVSTWTDSKPGNIRFKKRIRPAVLILLGFDTRLVVFAMAHHSKLFANFTSKNNLPIADNYVLLLSRICEMVRRDYEVGLNVVFLKIRMAIGSITILDLIVSIQVHQSFRCNVNSPDSKSLQK